jgi:hypothetical protein
MEKLAKAMAGTKMMTRTRMSFFMAAPRTTSSFKALSPLLLSSYMSLNFNLNRLD